MGEKQKPWEAENMILNPKRKLKKNKEQRKNLIKLCGKNFRGYSLKNQTKKSPEINTKLHPLTSLFEIQ